MAIQLQSKPAGISSTFKEIDESIKVLKSHKEKWANDVSLAERIRLLQECRVGVARVADKWVAEDLKARKVSAADNDSLISTLAGPATAIRGIDGYMKTLRSIEKTGEPKLPRPFKKVAENQLAVETFPDNLYDRLLFSSYLLQKFTGEVWFEPGYTEKELLALAAPLYRKGKIPGRVCLVLGAGNVSSITPTDILYKMFVEKQVVLLKCHPVLEYLGEILRDAFAPLIREGYLQIAYGGIPEGEYASHHPGIDSIHLTGSDKTYEKIIFGVGPEGEENKRINRPIIHKEFSAELGNVSPVIVVPGPWSQSDLNYHAVNLATGLTCNAGFNCIANRVIIQQQGWEQRDSLIKEVQKVLNKVPSSIAYYPNAAKNLEKVLHDYPEALRIGEATAEKTPWVFLPYLDPNVSHKPFREEVFGSFMSETALSAESTADYLERAVRFCNQNLWGTLSATLIVHPQSLKDPAIRKAVEKAIADLRYGIISLNQMPHLAFTFKNLTWGGYPGSSTNDIQSGIGIVNNTYMLDKVQKSVVRAPFKIWPSPMWFNTNACTPEISRAFLEFEKKKSLLNLMKVFYYALKGNFL